MEIEVSNKIIIKNYTSDLEAWCRGHLVLPNPEFYKKEKMGKWTGNTPRNIVLYERDADNLYLPFGCLKSIYNLCKDNASFLPKIAPFRRVNYNSDISLYNYQEEAVKKAISKKNGVIVMPCGAGKTQTGLELISRLGIKALWLTHTQDLLNQSFNRAKTVLGANKDSYGTITGGKVNIGYGITFATVQTMANIDIAQYKDAFDMIIVDECHKAIGTPTKVMMFYKVLSNISCRYKYGLTATPHRADGLEQCMFSLIGDIIHEVPKDAVKDTTCPVNVRYIDTGYFPNEDIVLAGDGTLNYARLIDDLIDNKDRFKIVSDTINGLKGKGAVLVLANRVNYLEKLKESCKLNSICLSTLGQSKGAKMVRKNALIALNKGELDCIFATYQLAKEGLDVPNLRYVVFASPEKDETIVIQSAGRVGRKADGKECGTVIDFVDNFGMYKGWQKKRENFYKKLDYNILT